MLSLLICPVCQSVISHASLTELRCVVCKKKYPIQHGVPILVDLQHLPAQLQHQVNYFSKEAFRYVKADLTPWQQKYVDRFFRFLGPVEGKIIIDNGSGSGYMSIEAAKRGATVIACDLNLSGLVCLNSIAKTLGIAKKIMTVCCSSENLPITGNIADGVIANAILEHLPKEQKAIEGIARVSKKNGVVMITVPIAYRLLNPLFLPINYIHDKRIGHLRRYTKELLQQRFSDWKLLSVYYSGHTRKVLKTLLNFAYPLFNEREIEDEDDSANARPLFASNISVLFKKR